MKKRDVSIQGRDQGKFDGMESIIGKGEYEN